MNKMNLGDIIPKETKKELDVAQPKPQHERREHSSQQKGAQRQDQKTEARTLASVSRNDLRKRVQCLGKVEKVAQTPGPTIFVLNDGTASFNVKGFIGSGKRAFPEINEGDLVKALFDVNEHQGNIEGEIVSIYKLSFQERETFAETVSRAVEQRIQPIQRPFLARSEVLEKLKPTLESAVRAIKKAIAENRPILLKHHCDTDGYSAAIALERAILPLIRGQHSDEKALWKYYVRTPSKSPYYDFYDATKDVSMALNDVAKFGEKLPLILIVDTGSGPQNELSIKTVRMFGCPVVVVDHHHFETDPITPLTEVHVNPHFVGSEVDFSAGMLCVEIARMIHENPEGMEFIAAMAGMADRIDSSEAKQYIELAEANGYTKEYLRQLSEVIDFMAWNFKFAESRQLVDVIFGSDAKKQRELVEMLYPEVMQKIARQREIFLEHAQVQDVNGVLLAKIDVENASNFGAYPTAGKATGSLHDALKEKNPGRPVLTVGYGPDFITMRSTDGTGFSVSEFNRRCQEKHPKAGIEGGGHEHAGSLKFIPLVKEKVLAELEAYLKEKNT